MLFKMTAAATATAILIASAVSAQTTTVTQTTDTTGNSALAGGSAGALAGAAVGGPVGALIGAAIGAGGGAALDPGETVTTYVTTNPVEPVYLEGDLVVGAGVPDVVVLQEVPETEYSYAYVNGVPVIVNPADRRIVQIIQ
jgi:hypothetical protein